jgi:hypothetical protein
LVNYDKATNAGGVWAKRIRDNPSEQTRRLANFLKHANRDALSTLEELTDEHTHHLLLEGCKLHYELTGSSTRPMGVFYSYDIALDGEAQDRELERRETSDKPPSDTEVREEERLHFMMKKKLLEVARYHLTAPETTWSSAPARDYSAGSHLPVETVDEAIKTTKARRTVWDDE